MTIIEQANQIRKDINVLTTSLTDGQGLILASLFEPWALKPYAIGDRVRHMGKLYKCVQAHTSQSDWAPDLTPALWVAVSADEYPKWAQPAGAHDAYSIGDKVTFEGKKYTSKINSNIWSPTAYPQGWELIN